MGAAKRMPGAPLTILISVRYGNCKATKGRVESKESDLVNVAHIEINNKCQMFRICSNSHADVPTFHFWNAFTQRHKIMNIFFPRLDFREPDVYCHMLGHSFQQNTQKRLDMAIQPK